MIEFIIVYDSEESGVQSIAPDASVADLLAFVNKWLSEAGASDTSWSIRFVN